MSAVSAPSTAGGRRRPWMLPLIVVIVATIALGTGFVIAAVDDDDEDRSDSSYAAQLANVQQACLGWLAEAEGDRPSGDWCSAMAVWMNQQAAGGRMMGKMMWGDPDRMAATCRRWATTNATTTDARGSDAQWCDDMVTWMRAHMGDRWDEWMMDSSMMGR